MIKVFKAWMDRYLSDPEAILLLVILLGGLGIILSFGKILMPVFVSIAITILLQFWVNLLVRYKCPQSVAMWVVYLGFVTVFLVTLFLLLPLLWRQCLNLITEMPTILQNGKVSLLEFIKSKKDYISEAYIETVMSTAAEEFQLWAKKAVSISIASIPSIITWIVYLILVPLLVFFFMQDHTKIFRWFIGFLPEKRELIKKVWNEMNKQIENYVNGKIIEIIIVGISTYFVFLFFDLRYQVLLACLVGLSVVIPYIGAVIVAIPVILVGYLQWGTVGGLTGEFALMLYFYFLVQFIDGNILVPLLFSEAVNLHPIAIIISILFFGAIWGFWGVFFAIPLATLIKAVINAWPRKKGDKHRKRILRHA